MIVISPDHVVAVGDGAAVFTGDRWIPQLGSSLWGLESLYIDLQVRPIGWAVGEGDRIARWSDGAWHLDDRALRDGTDLYAVSVPPNRGGPLFAWAAGARDGHAVLRTETLGPDEQPIWIDVPTGATDLPPITDIGLLGSGAGLGVGAWNDAQGAILGLTGDTWRIDQAVAGRPSELVATDEEAWAFGPRLVGTHAFLATWHAAADAGWEEVADLRLDDRTLVDAYQEVVGRDQQVVVVLALAPFSGRPLARTRRGNGPWEWLTSSVPKALADVRADGTNLNQNRAVAPQYGRGLLYAFGDGVWRYDMSADSWSVIRGRFDLRRVVAGASGAWALDGGGQGALVGFWGGKVARIPLPDAAVDLAGTTDSVWAISADGHAVRWSGPMGRARDFPAAADGHVRSAAARGGERLFAGGSAPGGGARLFAFRDTAWRTLGDPPPLRDGTVHMTDVVDVAVDGANRLVAVGPSDSEGVPGIATRLDPGCGPDPSCFASWESGVALERVAIAPSGVLWLAGAYAIFRCGPGPGIDCGYEPAPVPPGGHVAALAAAADDDAWAAVLTGPSGREQTLLLHRNAEAWHTACTVDVPINDLALVAAPDRRRELWAVGDWSTALRYTYTPDPAALPDCRPDA
jgi:hypothetical protein